MPETYRCEVCGHRHSLHGGQEPNGTVIPAGDCPVKRRHKSRTKAEWAERMRQLKERITNPPTEPERPLRDILRDEAWEKLKFK